MGLVQIALVLLVVAGATIASPEHHRDDGFVPELLIADLSGDGLCLTSVAEGVKFAFKQRGLPEPTGWTCRSADDAFVGIDQNRNGRIESVAEIVGGILGPPNGLEYLAAFDGYPSLDDIRRPGVTREVDHKFDERDAQFQRLILWTDINHNGKSEESEVQSAMYAGITTIDLKFQRVSSVNPRGNRITSRTLSWRVVNGKGWRVQLSTVALAGPTDGR